MKSETYPLALRSELLDEVRRTAEATGLSLADAMRQSLRLGLPKLRAQLAAPTAIKAFSAHEAKQAFAADPEWDAVAASMAQLPVYRVDD